MTVLEPGERALILHEMHEFAVGLQRIDDADLHILHESQAKLPDVDDVVLCASQEPVDALCDELRRRA